MRVFLRRAGGAPRAGVACDRAGAAYGRAGVFFTGIRGGYIYLSRPKAAVFAGLNDRPTDEISFPPDSAVPIAAWVWKKGVPTPANFPEFPAVGFRGGRARLRARAAPGRGCALRAGGACGRAGGFSPEYGVGIYICQRGCMRGHGYKNGGARARGRARGRFFRGVRFDMDRFFRARGGGRGAFFGGVRFDMDRFFRARAGRSGRGQGAE